MAGSEETRKDPTKGVSIFPREGSSVRFVSWFLAAAAAIWWLPGFLLAAPDVPVAPSKVKHPEWSRDAVIYELNTRQFTPEGTFKAILPRIPELKALGVRVVWFMPIHPIGEKERKGPLGSPYAVKDYYGVNPEFGTLEDFKAVVKAMHEAGLHVIIDLVANHTAWDNPLCSNHPSWFARDGSGRFRPPEAGWSDVVQLDYFEGDLQEYMLKVMEHWVRDVGIDGFRCDVAGRVPTAFWNTARVRLGRIRPVFMLAEAEKPELLQRAFDCDYGSEYFKAFDAIVRRAERPTSLDRLVEEDAQSYPPGAWRLMFTTNHDQNAWLDSDVQRLGPKASRAMAVLAFTLPGKPLIYNGQEIGYPKKLPFFSRGPIEWSDPTGCRPFYSRLCELYTSRPALHAGAMTRVQAGGSSRVYTFVRSSAPSDTLLVVVNCSGTPESVTLPCPPGTRRILGLLGPETHEVTEGKVRLKLEPWEHQIFECHR